MSRDEFRQLPRAETRIYDLERWPEVAGAGVRLYRLSAPRAQGPDGTWSLQVRAQVATNRGQGKRFAVGTASMSREDLIWLRDQINAQLRSRP